MTSVVDICNAAISHCGTRSKISSIGEGSTEALACSAHFDFVRDATLRAYDWNFARMTVGLGQLSIPIPVGQTVAPTSNVNRWKYEFVLPTDCIRLRRLNDTPIVNLMNWYELAADKDSSGAPISVLFCNQSPISAIYTMRVTDPTRWDAGFQDAMSYGLAMRIAFQITGKEEVVKRTTEMWRGFLSQAAADMMNENPDPAPAYMPEMLGVRGYEDGLTELGQAWPRPERW